MTSRGDTDVRRIDIFILNVFTNEELHKQFVTREQQHLSSQSYTEASAEVKVQKR